MDKAEDDPRGRGGKHTDPGGTGEVGDAVAGHRAEHQRAFQPEVDTAGAFRQRFSETDEQEGRGDADRAADDGEGDAPEADAFVHGVPHLAGSKILKRP